MQVLLVEDDSPTAQAVEQMLQAAGHDVYITDRGEEGMDLAKQHNYDVMLLNIDLPDMSGLDVLKTLRVARVRIPVIMLTKRAGIEDKVRAFGLGADDYVTKPFHKEELLARINALVRRCKGEFSQPAR